MATVTIRPDSYRDATGLTSGVLASVNDGSDTTYMQFTAGGKVTVGFANPSIPTGAQVRTVRLSYRTSTTSGTAAITSRLYVAYPSGAYTAFGYGWVANTSIRTFASPILAATPSNKTWTAADVNNLSATIYLNPNSRLYDVWIDVVYNVAPTVTVTAPTGSFTTSVRPEIDFAYADVEGNLQERYWVKVFTAAQYGIGGFDPEKSPATWDSGEVRSDAGGVTLPVNLINGGTYRAYAKVADVGSNGRYSTWAFSAFTIAVAVPAVPTLAAAATVATNVTLTVGGLTAGNGVVVERSDDAGVTWRPVRGAYSWLAVAGTLVATDYEPPVNVAVSYRAWQWNDDAFGNVFASGYTAMRTVTVTNSLLRLKDPANPGFQILISLRDNLQVTSPRAEGVFDPLGSAVAVVLVDATPGGDRIALPLQFRTDADWRAFMALRATGHVLQLLTDIPGDQWYVQLSGDAQTILQSSPQRLTRPYRTLDVTAVAVDFPPDFAPVPGT